MKQGPQVVVIGAGFGGLAAAIRLQARGFQVTLLEKRDQPGGRAYVYRDAGFSFDGGPTVVTAPFLFEELFALAGKRMSDYLTLLPVDPFYRIRFHDGRVFDYNGDAERMAAEVARFNPADVDGYPYFIQKYGEALWDAADAANLNAISAKLYASTRLRVQDALDAEFFENRYLDAPRADQLTLRVAAALGGERFEIAKLAAQFKSRNANATQQSVNRLLKSNHVYRVSQGIYAYTAPLFGDFVRRKYPRQQSDR